MKNYFVAKSRRVRSTPYTSRIENQGVTSYSVYNHMLLPAAFGSLEDAYHHLKENVQVWDVAAVRSLDDFHAILIFLVKCVVAGIGIVAGTECVIFANDPSVLAGAMTVYVGEKWNRAMEIARDNRLPSASTGIAPTIA